MAIDLSQIRRRVDDRPARMIFYGPEGAGKTTLAASFPSPIFFQTEDGAGDLEIASITGAERIRDWDTLCDGLGAILDQDHDFETLVLDSVDWTEEIIFGEAVRRLGYRDINTDSNGKSCFGHGYKRAADIWRELLGSLDAIRAQRRMNVVLLAHEQLLTIDEPDRASYSRRTVKLQRNGEAVVTEWADVIGHLNWAFVVAQPDQKTPKKQARVIANNELSMRFDGGPGYAAKNRYAVAAGVDEMVIPNGDGFEAIRYFLPNYREKNPAAALAAE